MILVARDELADRRLLLVHLEAGRLQLLPAVDVADGRLADDGPGDAAEHLQDQLHGASGPEGDLARLAAPLVRDRPRLLHFVGLALLAVGTALWWAALGVLLVAAALAACVSCPLPGSLNGDWGQESRTEARRHKRG